MNTDHPCSYTFQHLGRPIRVTMTDPAHDYGTDFKTSHLKLGLRLVEETPNPKRAMHLPATALAYICPATWIVHGLDVDVSFTTEIPIGVENRRRIVISSITIKSRDGVQITPEMLRAIDGREQRACACATALPFRDDTFAGTLCCRLLQHLPAAAERVAVLRELCRVSRGPVLVTFFDRRSLQSLRRAVRRALGKARSGRSSITRAEFQREARAAGLRVVRFVALRRFLAEQTFALCLPDAAT